MVNDIYNKNNNFKLDIFYQCIDALSSIITTVTAQSTLSYIRETIDFINIIKTNIDSFNVELLQSLFAFIGDIVPKFQLESDFVSYLFLKLNNNINHVNISI